MVKHFFCLFFASLFFVSSLFADDPGRIEMGDIIIECDGSQVRKSADLIRILDRHEVGDEVDIVIIRSGVKKSVRIIIQSDN